MKGFSEINSSHVVARGMGQTMEELASAVLEEHRRDREMLTDLASRAVKVPGGLTPAEVQRLAASMVMGRRA